MRKVRDRASLDERTVQKVARGDVTPQRRTRRAAGNRSSRVTTVRLDDRVWAVLKQQGTDLRCVQVVAPTEVIVWNHPAPWPERSNA